MYTAAAVASFAFVAGAANTHDFWRRIYELLEAVFVGVPGSRNKFQPNNESRYEAQPVCRTGREDFPILARK
jgi:hypothetical protein